MLALVGKLIFLGNKIGDLVVTLTGNVLKLLQDNQNGVVFTGVPISTTAIESGLSVRIIMKLGTCSLQSVHTWKCVLCTHRSVYCA